MDERYCGECALFRLSAWQLLPVQAQKLLQGWGKCESTGRVTHESMLCIDCGDYSEDEEGE